MSLDDSDLFDEDEVYRRGWVDGYDDAWRRIEAVLSDPEKLAKVASRDQRFSESLTAAVIGLLLAEAEAEKLAGRTSP